MRAFSELRELSMVVLETRDQKLPSRTAKLILSTLQTRIAAPVASAVRGYATDKASPTEVSSILEQRIR